MIVNNERYKYNRNGTKTATGRAAVDNGDALAEALRGMSNPEILQSVLDNGETVKASWTNLNPGMQRMVASNVLRGVMRRNGSVKIGTKVVTKP